LVGEYRTRVPNVVLLTGEEEESNVLQANVKLYLFDREKRNAPRNPFAIFKNQFQYVLNPSVPYRLIIV
jgi:hypothetical protein